jgi:hypothetical protein
MPEQLFPGRKAEIAAGLPCDQADIAIFIDHIRFLRKLGEQTHQHLLLSAYLSEYVSAASDSSGIGLPCRVEHHSSPGRETSFIVSLFITGVGMKICIFQQIDRSGEVFSSYESSRLWEI